MPCPLCGGRLLPWSNWSDEPYYKCVVCNYPTRTGWTIADLNAAPPDDAEKLNTSAHNRIDHTGLTGVSGFTQAAHAATNHAGLPGVGGLTEAQHASINHTGITGVGGAGGLTEQTHAEIDHSASAVTSLNTLKGNVTLAAGAGGTIEQDSETGTITISSGGSGLAALAESAMGATGETLEFGFAAGNIPRG